MPPRHRSFDNTFTITGTRTESSGAVYVLTAREGEWGTCDDFIGNRAGVNNLSLYKYQSRYVVFNGRWYNPATGALIRTLENVPTEYQIGPPVVETWYPSFSFGDLDNLGMETLAKTNPGVPSISVPQFVGELKDLPGLVEGWGRGLLKSIAQGQLAWQWCVRPMINDVMKLLQFAKAVEQRLRWLRKLRDGKKELHRRAKLRDRLTTVPERVVGLMSSACSYEGIQRETCTEQVWGTAVWKLQPGAVIPPERDFADLDRLARRLASGVTSYSTLAAAWELLPWSWLADWYLGLGTVFQANNSSLPVVAQRICIMRTTRAVRKILPKAGLWSSTWAVPYGSFEQMTTKKERRANVVPVIPFIPTALPLVDPRKWPVIADLVILKAPNLGPPLPTGKAIRNTGTFLKNEGKWWLTD